MSLSGNHGHSQTHSSFGFGYLPLFTACQTTRSGIFGSQNNEHGSSLYPNLFITAFGLLSKHASISSTSSGVNLRYTPTALTVWKICSGLDAPVIALDTFLFVRTHAMDNVATSVSSFSAIFINLRILSCCLFHASDPTPLTTD
jgi:hypothetical protein